MSYNLGDWVKRHDGTWVRSKQVIIINSGNFSNDIKKTTIIKSIPKV